MGISSTELAWMRSNVEDDILTDTCTITPRTHTADEVGGFSDGSGTPVTGVACFVQMVGPTTRLEQNIASRMDGEPLWEIFIPHDQAITTDSQVTHDSETYEVIQVADKGSNRLFRQAYMRRIP